MSRQHVAFVPRPLGTAYAPDAYAAAEGDHGWMGGLREEDAQVRLNAAYAPDAYGAAEGNRGWPATSVPVAMGTAYAPDASGAAEGDRAWPAGQVAMGQTSQSLRIEQEAVEAARRGVNGRTFFSEDMREERWARMPRVRGLREDDAAIVMRGLREDDAHILMRGLREEDAGIVLRGLREDDARIVLNGLREDDAAIIMEGLREEDANIIMRGLREDDASIMMRGLRENDAKIRMGHTLGSRSAERKGSLTFIGAEDFHPRFPVKVTVRGLGRITAIPRVGSGGKMSGIFDFLSPSMSSSEYLARLAQLKTAWAPVKRDLLALSAQPRNAIMEEMAVMKCEVGHYDRAVTVYIAEGAAGMTDARISRISRLETGLPTIRRLIDQANTFGPASTPQQEQQRVEETAKQDVQERVESTKSQQSNVLTDTILPVAAGVAGATVVAGGILLLA